MELKAPFIFKNGKFDLIKIKDFCSIKGLIKMKKQGADLEKIFTRHISVVR